MKNAIRFLQHLNCMQRPADGVGTPVLNRIADHQAASAGRLIRAVLLMVPSVSSVM